MWQAVRTPGPRLPTPLATPVDFSQDFGNRKLEICFLGLLVYYLPDDFNDNYNFNDDRGLIAVMTVLRPLETFL